MRCHVLLHDLFPLSNWNSTSSIPIVVSRISHYEMLFVIGILFVVISEDVHLSFLEIVLENGSDQPSS